MQKTTPGMAAVGGAVPAASAGPGGAPPGGLSRFSRFRPLLPDGWAIVLGPAGAFAPAAILLTRPPAPVRKGPEW